MYHYRESKLPNIWLSDGYSWAKTSHGKVLQVQSPEQLEDAIEQAVVAKQGSLIGEEFRFLRESLDLSRAALADMFGLSEKTISSWENFEPPVWADRLLRALWSDENSEAFPLISFFEAGSDRVAPRSRSRRLVFTKHPAGDWYETSARVGRRS